MWEKVIPPNAPLDTKTVKLKILTKIFDKEPIVYLSILQKRKNSLFGENFPQKFLWRHRKHFCQRCKNIGKRQKISVESPEFFQKMSNNDDWWNINKKFSFTRKLHRTREKPFRPNWLLNLPKCFKFFTQCPGMFQKRSFHREKTPLSSLSIRRKQTWKSCRETNANRPIHFFSECLESIRRTRDLF